LNYKLKFLAQVFVYFILQLYTATRMCSSKKSAGIPYVYTLNFIFYSQNVDKYRVKINALEYFTGGIISFTLQ